MVDPHKRMGQPGIRQLALLCLLGAFISAQQSAGLSVNQADLVGTEESSQTGLFTYGQQTGSVSEYVCDPGNRGDGRGGRNGRRRVLSDDPLERERAYYLSTGPSQYKLSRVNASEFGVYNGDLIPAPRDQGACSTGVAEAFAAAIDATIATLLNRIPADVYRASVPDLYYCSQPGARSCPSGWTIPAAASQVQARMPQDERTCAAAATGSLNCAAVGQCTPPPFTCTAKELTDFWEIQRHMVTKGGVVTVLNQYTFDGTLSGQASLSFDNFVAGWSGRETSVLESPLWEFVDDVAGIGWAAGDGPSFSSFLNRNGYTLNGVSTAVALVGYDASADSAIKTWYVLNSKGPDWPKPGVGADSVFKAAFGAAGIGAAGQTYGLECTPVPGSVFDPWGLESWRPRKPLMPENASVALDVTNPICYLYKPVRPDWTDNIAAQFGIGIVDLVDANQQFYACPDNTATTYKAGFNVSYWDEVTGANNGVTLRICGIPPPSFSQVAFIEDPTLRTQRAMLRLYAALTSTPGTLPSPTMATAAASSQRQCVGGSVPAVQICMAPSTNAVSITIKGTSSAISGAVQQLLGLAAAKEMLEMPGGVSITIALDQATNRPSLALPSSWSGVTTLRSVVVTGYCLAAALPDGWKGLPNLQTLHIVGAAGCSSASNTYPLPAWAGGMPALTVLELRNLNVAGAIPGTWSTFPRLQQLLLRNVRVSGPLPASYGSGLRAIKSITISTTRVTGSIPAAWGSLSPSLSVLDLSVNPLRGCIPATLFRRTIIGRPRLIINTLGTFVLPLGCRSG